MCSSTRKKYAQSALSNAFSWSSERTAPPKPRELRSLTMSCNIRLLTLGFRPLMPQVWFGLMREESTVSNLLTIALLAIL